MIAGVAHEIYNPLAAISGIAQLLDMHPDAAIRADAQTILRMAERANRVVRALLTYARGTEDRARDLHTLPALVDQAMELCAHHLRKADVSMIIRRQTAEEDPQVCVNASQIEQILVNLINNAEHALRSKPADERFIVIASGVEGGMAFLSVTDTGCGIPDTLRQRIFDPFVSTKGIGEGTGLGLSICHGIATAHNGAIEVVSGEGIGSTFTLRLPLASAAPSV
jgi:signal transduction histidine kinase